MKNEKPTLIDKIRCYWLWHLGDKNGYLLRALVAIFVMTLVWAVFPTETSKAFSMLLCLAGIIINLVFFKNEVNKTWQNDAIRNWYLTHKKK
jgi:hypothetical protein